MNIKMLVMVAILAVVIFIGGWFVGSVTSGCGCGEGCHCQEQTTMEQ